jgi:hypothetical protein
MTVKKEAIILNKLEKRIKTETKHKRDINNN